MLHHIHSIGFEQPNLIIRCDGHRRIIGGRRSDGVPSQCHGNRPAIPVEWSDSAGLHQYLLARQPVPRIDLNIPDDPIFIVDDEILHVTDFAVPRTDSTAGHGGAAAKMGLFGGLLKKKLIISLSKHRERESDSPTSRCPAASRAPTENAHNRFARTDVKLIWYSRSKERA